MNITMRRFLTDPELAGEVYAGDSWLTWRTVLIGCCGEPLSVEETDVFHTFTGRMPPQTLLWLWAFFIGRRGGKDAAIRALIAYLALCREWKVSPGETPVVLLLAADREQAKVAYGYILGLLRACPVLEQEIVNVTADRIVLGSGVEIQVATSDFAAVRGRTVVAAVLDEFAFWSDDQGVEVLRALRPAMATQPNAVVAIITTIYGQSGPAFELFRQWGQDSDQQIIVKGSTRDFNPTVPQAFVDAELARDPEAAQAEYLTIPRSDIAPFIDAALIDSVTRSEPRELPYLAVNRNGAFNSYFAGLDVSGGRSDAAGCAVAHMVGDLVIVDAVRRWPAPHDPQVVAGEVAAFLREYKITSAHADEYAAEFARSVYASAGVALVSAPGTRSEAYLHMLPLMTTGRIELPPEPVLRNELLGLERRTGRNGRDTVDHRPHCHDDLSNCVALAAWQGARKRKPADQETHATHSTILDGMAGHRFYDPHQDFRNWQERVDNASFTSITNGFVD